MLTRVATRSACMSCKSNFISSWHGSLRMASSSAANEDNQFPPWPSSANPNPYEIFGLKKSDFSKQKARKVFYRMAKLYHPDVAPKEDGTGRQKLTRQARAERFRKINEAYEILKSDSKRRSLDAKLAMERRGRSGAASTMYHYHHQHAKATSSSSSTAYSDSFYHRGEYEGYEEEAERRSQDAKFQDALKQSRKKIVILLSATVGIIAVLELIAVFRLTEKAQARREHESYLAEVANIRAQANYGLGLESEDRVSRFLNMRNSSGYYDNYRIDNFSPSLSLMDSRRSGH